MRPRRRAYPEILESLLTTIAGGVAAESHPFPGPDGAPLQHSLLEPARSVVSVYGFRNGQSHEFKKDVDFELVDETTFAWKEGGEQPDLGTLFQVSYQRQTSGLALTDLQIGSVTRTLTEAIGLEFARLYAQLELVYDSGYVHSATKSSLDNVVALLGVTRVEAGRAGGVVQFTRTAGTPGEISVPAGTRILTATGDVEYETTEAVVLSGGQSQARAPVRDLALNDPLPADALTVLARPIAGIATVTNPAPTAVQAQPETDEELRTRAINFLHGSERATLGALEHAVRRQQLVAEVLERPGEPGYVDVIPHAEELPPELEQRVRTAIHDTRPAGVIVALPSAEELEPPRRIDLTLRLKTRSGLTQDDLRSVQRSVRDSVKDYFDRLPIREAGSINRVVGLVLAVPEVEDVRLADASWDGPDRELLDRETGRIEIADFATRLGELEIVDPSLPTEVRVVVTFPEASQAPDRAAIEVSLSTAVTTLNALNETELTDDAPAEEAAKRLLTYARLLRSIPLPGKPAEPLAQIDAAPAAAPEVAPYQVVFVITSPSLESRTLSGDGDPGYTLTALERLSVAGVEVDLVSTDG